LMSGTLYWPTTAANVPVYPGLEEDIECDLLIVGGGSSGAQCAYTLSDTGLRVAVVEREKAGYGSTIANLGLVQVLGEKMLFELVDTFGEETAIRHTRLCQQAVLDIDAAARDIPIDCEFMLRDSLYTASSESDVAKLKRDFDLLVPHGFRVDWWSEGTIRDCFPFSRPAALFMRDEAELNPFTFTLGLLEKAKERGVRIFENTEIQSHTNEPGAVVFRTSGGRRIRAGHAIVATGYETMDYKKDPNAVMASSYAVITEPVEDLTEWYRRALIWETARPYVYMRTTADNRILIGGLDEQTDVTQERDRLLSRKKERLLEEFGKLFPRIPVRSAYEVAAFFGRTNDGLPMIARYPEYPRCSFLYAYGDNGLVYAMLLAKLLRDELTGVSNPDMSLYVVNRPTGVKSS
jgi:glycine/D-amino acid oxidase-like deaminating enzyme